jgi:hypothetical protein
VDEPCAFHFFFSIVMPIIGYFAPKYTTYFGVKYTINFGGKYTTFLEVSLINFGPSLPVMRSWI